MLESKLDPYEDGKTTAFSTLLTPTSTDCVSIQAKIPDTPTCNNITKILTTHLPFGIATVSLIQIFSFGIFTNFHKILRFEPKKINQLWRFVTYMFLHENWIHLTLNVSLQLLFAYFLELRHCRLRVVILYFLGGITAVLGASCFHADLIIGASGGVYTLLLSHLSDVMMNFENISYKRQRCCCVVMIVLSDVVYNVIHFCTNSDPVISWQTHVVGGISGLLLGLVFFEKKIEQCVKRRQLVLFWTGLFLYIGLVSCLVVLTIQIKKCTPAVVQAKYIYFC